MKKTWCITQITAGFLSRMERVLWLYAQEYDERFPVICYDERPCFLIGELVKGIAMKSGQVEREHYAYQKNGSCSLLMAIEPKTGKRVANVFKQRTKREFALHFQAIAREYPNAEKIRVVLDNLNTHNESSFYEWFSAEEAFELSQKFEFYYTPKSASWLNMIEIEFSALSRQCLSRRIGSEEFLKKEVLALVKEREKKRIKIDWQFSIAGARRKLNRHYEKVNVENGKYKNT